MGRSSLNPRGGWLRKVWHRHEMRNLSSGSDLRYCVAGRWDKEQGRFVRCPYTDRKAK